MGKYLNKALFHFIWLVACLLSYTYAQTSTLTLPLDVTQVKLIDVYLNSNTLPLTSPQNAGASLSASPTTPSLQLFLDYSSNSPLQQKIDLSISSLPSGLSFSTQFVSSGTAINSVGNKGSPKSANFSVASPSATIIDTIKNTAVDASILEFKLNESVFNFAEAGTHTITLTFTLSDE